jgi:hypothetical protein
MDKATLKQLSTGVVQRRDHMMNQSAFLILRLHHTNADSEPIKQVRVGISQRNLNSFMMTKSYLGT